MNLTAKDIMTKDVIFINEDNSIYEAIKVLVSVDVNCLHVLNSEGILVGIVTETDLVYISKKLSYKDLLIYS
ncbi:HPP family protein [Clostridium formicaceticum]|uniref:CBS domain protein n=1 Tax=Clostridium formicaceticum TaxID=1497 RepID=A0AAC9RK89_9CLOT|nr:CBS domain-containing protein [Clostridium formicaceticum]AOY78019.1 hypothetical protein BJL90_20425 [Clostridium formicaceticum]ARE88654.1 CBS domain protein [Clostridium formicaceticum]